MLVLFDNGTPRNLARHLIDHHTITEARARGWDKLENGELLMAAEAAGFEVILTTDRNLRYQQNLIGQNRGSRLGQRAVDTNQAPRCKGCSSRELRDSWQLCRRRDTRRKVI
jgi:hypothetical protein